MKILVLSFFSRDEITPRAFRADALCRALMKLGHEVEFVTARKERPDLSLARRSKPRSSSSRNMRKFGGKLLTAILPDGWRFFETLRLYRKVTKRNVDLTISIGLPFSVHLVTYLLVKTGALVTKSLIADYGDPYSTNSATIKPFYAKLIERKILKIFDAITVPVSSAISAYEGVLVPKSKIKVIPQGFNLDANYSGNYKGNKVPTFAYAGSLYKKIRDPSAFLGFLAELKKDFEFHIYTDFSNSATMEILEPYIKRLGPKLVLHDKVTRDQCLEVLSEMDFYVNFENTSSTQSPSKIVDYVLAGRPFLDLHQDDNDYDLFLKFLSGNFLGFQKPDISRFDENNVAQKFLELSR